MMDRVSLSSVNSASLLAELAPDLSESRKLQGQATNNALVKS